MKGEDRIRHTHTYTQSEREKLKGREIMREKRKMIKKGEVVKWQRERDRQRV